MFASYCRTIFDPGFPYCWWELPFSAAWQT